MLAGIVTSAKRQHQLDEAAGPDRAIGGREYCAALAQITDDWVVDVFDAAVAANPLETGRVALLAAGGFGRGELAPQSDLDLLLVHDVKAKKVAKFIEPIASAIWYPLWDAGAKVGHAVRRVDEQLDLARTDLDSATALITARPLAGDDELAREAIESGRAQWEKRSQRYLETLQARVEARRQDAGAVAYRLEPDLKDGHGGLRDVQSLWWAHSAGLRIQPEDLVDLDRCYGILVRARVALHQTIRRSGEVLRLEDQDAVAVAGEWADADVLMADVAAAGRTIGWLCEENWGRLSTPSKPEPEQLVAPGIVMRAGEIELTADADPQADPTLVLQAAVGAARHDCRIGRATLERLNDEVELWPGVWPLGATDHLVALLLEGHRSISVLEALDQRELISRLLPEWEPVRSKPQRNAYHRFTVDRHLWEAAANAAEIADRVSRPDLLVLGAFLHDLGKGYPGDHTEVGMDLVRTIGPRLGFGAADVEVLVMMVEHHLLLPDVAMRRDLTDEATIAQVAEVVGSVEVLDLLHALTEADSMATGPAAWGTWKEGLVNDLVERVRFVLGGGDVGEATWRLFPDAETLELMARGAINIVTQEDLVTVVCPDSSGTFGQIAGVLTLHGLDVVSAQAHSDEGGMAASQFRIQGPDSSIDWVAIEGDLSLALANEFALEARLAERARTYRRRRPTQAEQPGPPTVEYDDDASSNSTVLVVRANSKIGILHRITKALAELGLDIRHATVQTTGMEVVDTFYVRSSNGGLVTKDFHRQEIRRAVLHAVS